MVGLTMDDYVNFIHLRMGGTVVDIEVEQNLKDYVNLAFQTLKTYIRSTQSVTIPYSNTMDVSAYHMAAVVMVRRASPQYGLGTGVITAYPGAVLSPFMTTTSHSSYGINSLADVLQRKQIMASLSTDCQFHFIPETSKLMVSIVPPLPAQVTVEYIEDFQNVSQIIKPIWQGYLKELSLGYAMQATAEIRSKYSLNSSQWSNNGESLIQRGTKIVEDTINKLRDSEAFLFPQV